MKCTLVGALWLSPAIPQALKISAVKAWAGKDFGQIRIPGQILFACLRLRFRYPDHYYG
jgi:hypothetical protein